MNHFFRPYVSGLQPDVKIESFPFAPGCHWVICLGCFILLDFFVKDSGRISLRHSKDVTSCTLTACHSVSLCSANRQ